MPRLTRHVAVVGLLVASIIGVSSSAHAQTSSSPWSVDFAIGWDNDIAGSINSSAIGTLNNQSVVILKNTYEDVYGTGLHLRGGVGYQPNGTNREYRATITFQSLDADDVVPMGDIGLSKLYAKYSDYQALSLDLGVREYYDLRSRLQGYADATIGIGFIDKIDAQLVAPSANLNRQANDLYDQTVAFSLGANAGLMFQQTDRLGLFVQMGLKWVSGLEEVDDLVGTGLETLNDKSSRWTVPFLVGARLKF
jgi:hypothetical protein